MCCSVFTPQAVVLAEDPEYLAKRAKNNEAIKKSREKARIKVGDWRPDLSRILKIFLL